MSTPYSGGFGNEPTEPNAAVAAPMKSRRGLWITLSVIVALLIILGGAGVYAFAQYTAPGVAAAQFCNDLKAQNYSAAYGLLASDLKTQFSQDAFTLGSQDLDADEGKVAACTSTGYSYTLFGSTATVAAKLSRNQSYQGNVHLKSESGTWKVSGLDTSLLGANLGALKVAAAFCAALQAKSYTTAFGLFDPASQQGVTQDLFAAALQAHDAIDGPVTGCKLVSVGSGNTDDTTTLTVSITRATLGAKQGPMTLKASGGMWKITTISANLQGSDIGPLVTGNLTGAYQTLTSSDFRANVSQADFDAFFGLNPGQTYVGCTPDLTTYKVSGTSASYDAKLTVSISGNTVGVPVTLTFIQENGNWLLFGAQLKD